jgi:valine--pyruvate aminotransferase
MELSIFGEKFSAKTGILELMDDLGAALNSSEKLYMLGGGNPAHIPEVNAIWHKRMKEILSGEESFNSMLANYDSSQGNDPFLSSLANLLHNQYGWEITAENIAITNGSQSAFFFLLNMFSGTFKNSRKKKVLFPLIPEYIGYADQSIEKGSFTSRKSIIKITGKNEFKYFIDFDNLDIDETIAAICVSRPTNPTGNVLTDEEINKLSEIAENNSIPLLIDNAYGAPFPHMIFNDINPVWNKNIILGMSLSKLGLPSVRTGIIIASEEIIRKISAVNAIISLSSGSIGQVLTLPFIESGEILRISESIIKPYYLEKSRQAAEWIKQSFDRSIDYYIHKSEGAFFLWIWFRNLSITTMELYEKLKQRKVLIIPGEYFYFGLDEPWPHKDECIRLTYSQSSDDVKKGIEIIADEVKKWVE